MKLNVQMRDDYRLKPIKVFQRRRQLSRPACCYEPEDVQVLQKLAQQLEQKLMPGLTDSCFHLKGRGGHKLLIRYMDDWVILEPNRYKLREAVAKMNAVLAELKLEKHPDKTFIGRLSHGFDALGYQFSEEGLTGPSATAVQRFGARIAERYAQHESRESLLQYVNRWLSWQFGLGHTALGVPGRANLIGSYCKQEGVKGVDPMFHDFPLDFGRGQSIKSKFLGTATV